MTTSTVAGARAWTAAAAIAAAALLVVGGWWRSGTPVELPEGGRMPLQCVSYAPSAGTTERPDRVSRDHIRRDLGQLAQRFGCVRTYSVSHGLDQVPEVAQELGLRVLLGLWIGADAAANEREIALGVATARRWRASIDAIVVGNEVLLRHELPAAKLAPLIERVGRETGLPVTYADVWGRWIANRDLARSVSFVTVHILPYWDDEPVDADLVMPYVERLYLELQALFPGKSLLVGETGWPSAGKPRGDLEPGRVEQARYLREFTALAERRGIPYNLIEAYDQPWKRAPEGTVGGYWGLLDAAGREKFPWTGPVAEAPHAPMVLLVSLLLAGLGVLGGLVSGGARRGRRAVVLGAAGALVAGIAARQFDFLRVSNLGWLDWVATIAVVAAGWIAFGAAIRGLLRGTHGSTGIPRPLALFLLAAAGYVAIGLTLAGRHRDLPLWVFLPAVAALAIASWLDPADVARRLESRRGVEEIVLAAWLVAAGALTVVVEGTQTGLAIAWAASCLLLGLGVLVPLALQAREHQRADEHAGG